MEIIDLKTQNWCGHNVRFVKYCGTWYAVLKDICDALNLHTYNISYVINAHDLHRIYEVTSLMDSKSIAVTSYIQENADPFFV